MEVARCSGPESIEVSGVSAAAKGEKVSVKVQSSESTKNPFESLASTLS